VGMGAAHARLFVEEGANVVGDVNRPRVIGWPPSWASRWRLFSLMSAIINISSVAGYTHAFGTPNLAYIAAKRGAVFSQR
jgi:NAD(P)-dependent dehydrogenase (short-subunit alcohol dehydrogenase family)